MDTSCNVQRTVDDSRGLSENCNSEPIQFKLEAIDHTDHGLKHIGNSIEVTSYSHPGASRLEGNSDARENINKNGLVTFMGEIRTNNSKEFKATSSYSSNECEQNFRNENQIDRYEQIESNNLNYRHRGIGTNQNEDIKPSSDTFSQLVRTNLAYEELHLKHYTVVDRSDRLTILNVPKLEDEDAMRMNLSDVVASISNNYVSYDVIESDALCASLPNRVQSSISSEEFNAICRFVGDSSATATGTLSEESNGHRSTSVASFRCDTCPREFLTEKYLHMHKSLHITPGKTAFSSSSSSGGGSETESATMLASVHRRHSTDTGDQLQLPPAAKLLKLDFDGTQWSCNICKKTFAQNSNYKNHVRTHSNERPFICDVCSIGFKERYHLKKHILFKHTDEMKEECRVCGKRFKDSTAVRAHERIHSDARPYGCRRCGKTFKTSECLWHHENRSRTCGTTLDGTSQLGVCQVQTAKHGVQRHAGRKVELAEAFGIGYSHGRGGKGGGGLTLEQNQRIFTPVGRDNLIDGMSPITTHIKMEELDPPAGSCDDFSENYLNALSMSSGLAFYEFRDIDAPPPMTSSDMTPLGDYDEKGPAAKRCAVGDDRKERRKLVAGPQSPIIATRKLIKSSVSLSSASINNSNILLNIPQGKNAVENLSYNGSCSTNLDFVVTEEPLETEHDKIMRFISEYDGSNRSANDMSKRINDGGAAASLSPPTAAVFPNWQQHKNPILREAAKSVVSEDHRFCYGNFSNLPTAVVAPIQREASFASSCSASAPVASSCTDSVPLAMNSTNLNTNLEQKNALPPFETFAPIMRSSASVNQVGYRPPPLQQPTRYRQPAQQVKPRLQTTSMLSVTRPEFVYRPRQPLRLAMMPKCEPSAADECPTLQKYLLNNNISGYQHQNINSTHPTFCSYLPVPGSNTQQVPVKSRSTVAATEVTHFNGYPINSAKINPSTYLYSDPQWGRFQAPEVEDVKVDCGTIYGATNEIWYVDNAEHHLIQKVYATNLPGDATAQVYAMNLSGAVISPIGNEIGRRNQMI